MRLLDVTQIVGYSLVVGVIVVLLCLAFGYPGPLKTLAENRLSESLGQPVTIEGPVTLRFIPSPKLEFKNLAIGPNAAKRVRLDHVVTRVEFWPLFLGQFRSIDVQVTSASVKLVEGQWPLVARDGAEPAGETDGLGDFLDLLRSVKRFDIQDLLFEYQGSAVNIPLKGRLEGSMVMSGLFVRPLTVTGSLEAPTGAIKAQMSLSDVIGLLRNREQSLTVTVGHREDQVNLTSRLTLGDVISLRGDLRAEKVTLSAWQTLVDTFFKPETPVVAEAVETADAPPTIALPALPKNFNVDLTWQVGQVELPTENMTELGGHLTLTEGRLTLDPLEFGWLGAQYKGTVGYYPMEEAGQFLTVTGDVKAEKLTVSTWQTLVDTFFKAEEIIAPELPDAKVEKAQIALPPLAKNIDVDMTWQVGQVELPTQNLTGVEGHLTLTDGRLTLDPFQLGWLGGQFKGAAGYYTIGEDGHSLTLTGDELDLSLIDDFLGDREWEGRLAIDVALTAVGADSQAALSSLAGTAKARTGKAVLDTYYLEVVAADLVKALFADKNRSRSNVKCFDMKADIEQGVAKLSSLVLDTSKLVVTGKGSVDLVQQKLDIKLNPRPKSLSLINITPRINVGGTFSEPKVSPDSLDMLTDVATTVGAGAFGPIGYLLSIAKAGTLGESDCAKTLREEMEAEAEKIKAMEEEAAKAQEAAPSVPTEEPEKAPAE